MLRGAFCPWTSAASVLSCCKSLSRPVPQFPLSPRASELEGRIFSCCMSPCSGAWGFCLCRSCLPRAAPTLPEAVAWKSSRWERLHGALAAAGAAERGGTCGTVTQAQEMLLHGDTLAFCPVPPWHSAQGSGGSRGASSGRCLACPRAALARLARDSLPERQLPRGSVSKRPRRCVQTTAVEREPQSLSPGPGQGVHALPCQGEPGSGWLGGRTPAPGVANRAACVGVESSKVWSCPALAKVGRAVRRQRLPAGMWQ